MPPDNETPANWTKFRSSLHVEGMDSSAERIAASNLIRFIVKMSDTDEALLTDDLLLKIRHLREAAKNSRCIPQDTARDRRQRNDLAFRLSW